MGSDISSFCSAFREQDNGAFEHCVQWGPAYGLTYEILNRGISYVDYTTPLFPGVKIKDDPTAVSSQEYYRWVLEQIRQDPQGALPLAEDLFKKTGIKIPFLFTDYNADTHHDEQVRTDILDFLKNKKATLAHAGYLPESREYKISLILSARNYVSHHLNVKGSPDADTFDALGSINQMTDCQGISNPYFGILLLAGLNPQFETVEWKEAGNPHSSMSHARVFVPLNQSNMQDKYIVDAAMGVFGDPIPGEVSVPASDADFVANQYYNLLIEDPDMPLEKQKPLVEAALKLAPYNYRVLTVSIPYFEAIGDDATAKGLYDRLLEVFPYPDTWAKRFPHTASHP